MDKTLSKQIRKYIDNIVLENTETDSEKLHKHVEQKTIDHFWTIPYGIIMKFVSEYMKQIS